MSSERSHCLLPTLWDNENTVILFIINDYFFPSFWFSLFLSHLQTLNQIPFSRIYCYQYAAVYDYHYGLSMIFPHFLNFRTCSYTFMLIKPAASRLLFYIAVFHKIYS